MQLILPYQLRRKWKTIIPRINFSKHFYPAVVHCKIKFPKLRNDDTGLPHFLEHVLFHKYDDPINRKRLSDLGLSINAATSRTETLITFLASDVNKSTLQEIVDFIMRPSIEDSKVESEKRVICMELDSVYRDETQILIDHVFKFLYGNHPFISSPILGEKKHINAITADDLRKFHRNIYTKKNMTLVVKPSRNKLIHKLKNLVKSDYSFCDSLGVRIYDNTSENGLDLANNQSFGVKSFINYSGIAAVRIRNKLPLEEQILMRAALAFLHQRNEELRSINIVHLDVGDEAVIGFILKGFNEKAASSENTDCFLSRCVVEYCTAIKNLTSEEWRCIKELSNLAVSQTTSNNLGRDLIGDQNIVLLDQDKQNLLVKLNKINVSEIDKRLKKFMSVDSFVSI